MLVDSVSVNYRIINHASGGDGRTIVFIHGFGASLYSWSEVLDSIPGRDILLVDLKGHGYSDKAQRGDYSPQAQAELVAGLLRQLDVRKPILIGHSFGGAVAFLTYLLLREDEHHAASGIIFVDAATYPQDLPFFVEDLLHPVKRFLATHFTSAQWRAEYVLSRIYAPNTRISARMVDRYAFFWDMSGASEALQRTAEQIVPVNHALLVAKLKSIDVPTLIIWGEDDPVIPPAFADRLRSDIPNSHVCKLAGVGHVPQEEAPVRTANCIRTFAEGIK